MFFKIINNMVDIPHTFVHSAPYSTCGQNKFIHLQSRTKSFKNPYFSRTIKLWNRLPEVVIKLDNLENLVQSLNNIDI